MLYIPISTLTPSNKVTFSITGNFRQEFHSESSPKHIKPEDPENMTDPVADSPNSRYIHFSVDSPSSIFKETDI